MYPAAESTARPSGTRHSVSCVLGSVPSGLSEKTRPPLKSSTNRRPLEEREAVMSPPERDVAAGLCLRGRGEVAEFLIDDRRSRIAESGACGQKNARARDTHHRSRKKTTSP